MILAMNCTTETKYVFNVRKGKSINICLWHHSMDRCVVIAQQWTHIKRQSNLTLTDFVIKEAEHDCEPC